MTCITMSLVHVYVNDERIDHFQYRNVRSHSGFIWVKYLHYSKQ